MGQLLCLAGPVQRQGNPGRFAGHKHRVLLRGRRGCLQTLEYDGRQPSVVRWSRLVPYDAHNQPIATTMDLRSLAQRDRRRGRRPPEGLEEGGVRRLAAEARRPGARPTGKS